MGRVCGIMMCPAHICVAYIRGVSFVSTGVVMVAVMPSYLHELLVEMFRDRPALVAELLTGVLGIPVPAFQAARLSSSDLTDVAPTEYRADAVITLTTDDDPRWRWWLRCSCAAMHVSGVPGGLCKTLFLASRRPGIWNVEESGDTPARITGNGFSGR
jgi:hypothetical protein